MRRFTSASLELLQSKAFLIIAGFWTVLETGIGIATYLGKIPSLVGHTSLLIHTSIGTGIAVTFGVGLVLSNSSRLRRSFTKLHDLNHLYRNTLAITNAQLLQLDGKKSNQEINELLARTEDSTVQRVLGIIADQFSLLINRQVVVTFWRYIEDDSTCIEQETSAQGKDASRPFQERASYSKAHNSVFRDCRGFKGKCCHYFSEDITAKDATKEGYTDERPDYGEHYQSVLCVPIRFSHGELEDVIGYLQIDTKSRHRLNDVEHLYILSAYADQLYNFLSLVRRNFMFS